MIKKMIFTGIVLSFCASFLFAQTAVAPSAGDGSESNPYQIASLDNLYWITTNMGSWSANYIQIADINASETLNWFDGQGWFPIGNSTTKFTGSYNGQDYTIDSLYINREENYCALFKYTNEAVIENIGLINTNITGYSYVGGLVSYNRNTTITNCYIKGFINGNNTVGGLVGYNNYYAIISNCYSEVFVTGNNNVGGLVGNNSVNSTINYCSSNGIVNGQTFIGGLVGLNSFNISNSYSIASVTASDGYLGGLVGSSQLNSSISCCYSKGDVSGSSNGVGGLVGVMNNTNVINSYSNSHTSGQNAVGGLVGSIRISSQISNSYSSGEVIGSGGGLVGENMGSPVNNSFWDIDASGQNISYGGIGKTTAQMKIQTTFTASEWDFLGMWALNDTINGGYPHLLWQTYIDPFVETASIEPTSENCALINCQMVYLGNPDPIQHGVCWSTANNPTIDDNKTELGEVHNTGSFSSEITDLIRNTVYYIRTYATNAKRTVYGETLSFMNNPNIPSIFHNITEGSIEGGLSLIDDNAIYAVSSNDGVYRYNKDGNNDYKLNVDGDIKSSTTITPDHNVYIASTDYNLYSFNSNGLSNSGWPISLGAEATASVAIDNSDNCYIGTSNGVFQCVSSDGTINWGYNVGAPVYASSAISSDNILYVINENGRILAFDLNNINPLSVEYEWVYELGESVVTSPALDDEGYLYVTTLDGNLIKLDVDTSDINIAWEYSVTDPIYSSPITGSDYTTYFGSINGNVYAINKDGTLKWETDLEHPIKSTASIAEFGTDNDRLYIGSDGGYLNTLSLSDGLVVDKYKTDADVRCPILYNDNTIYFGTMDGEVIAIPDTVEDTSLSKKLSITSQWPTFQGNNQRTGVQKQAIPATSAVYPGDTNNDGSVDELDILPIGVYFLEEGTLRNNASSVWEGQDVTSWPSYPANYADCNGDGVVDEKDIIPVGVNWGSSRTTSIQKFMINPNDKQMLAKHKEAFETIYNSMNGIESGPAKAIRQLLETTLEIIPKTITLNQCYPNPFNPTTEIKFSIPEKMTVSLKVYDINGKYITTLINGTELGTGYHQITFSGDAYPSGMYIYVLESETSIQAQKMLLVK